MAKTGRPKIVYDGILAEPVPRWGLLTAPTDDELRKMHDEKMKALFVHYKLDPTDAFEFDPARTAIAWSKLAWHLARDHVPGFSEPPRKRGKPAKLTDENISLAMHVELLKRRDGLSDRKAITMIAAQKLIPGSEQALRQRYKRTKKSFVPMAVLFDNIVAAKGSNLVVSTLEEVLLRGH
ncbi:hypothetical protein [Bradyrhizobium sp. 192]|uniref:hypothetical protein n=1 Tax=Bradyrhizobium sp. 192 TaxID=2782660 RepID=UPI001FFE634D|nr:hypothetical protein [Bradyrhizobium sp. 192]UPJ55228.1 hypothetical protein IVB24_21350 [Bradyrhizobium sp. 192]